MIRTVAWSLHKVAGLAGLASPIAVAGDLLLIGLLAWGAWRCVRSGRGAVAILLLGLVGLYPVTVVAGTAIVPVTGSRLCFPVVAAVAVLAGIGLDGIARTRAWPLAALFLGLLGWSSLREQGRRSKYEDVPAALAFADMRADARAGMRSVPVLACTIFTAGSVWAADPARRVYVRFADGGLIRFDEGAFAATRMPLTRLLRAGSGDVSRFLGQRRYPVVALDAVLARPLLAIVEPCDPGFRRVLARRVARGGLAVSAAPIAPPIGGAIEQSRTRAWLLWPVQAARRSAVPRAGLDGIDRPRLPRSVSAS